MKANSNLDYSESVNFTDLPIDDDGKSSHKSKKGIIIGIVVAVVVITVAIIVGVFLYSKKPHSTRIEQMESSSFDDEAAAL